MERKQFLPPLQAVASGLSKGSEFDGVLRDGSPEEMDDSAISIGVMAELLVSGSDEEIMIIVFETQQLLKLCREFALQTLVPLICQEVATWSQSLQHSAAEALTLVVHSDIPTTLTKTICTTALEVIRSSSVQSICDLWGEIVVLTLPRVSLSATELDDIVDSLETHQGASGFKVSRKLTARILGSLAACSKEDDLKIRIMHRAIVISDDEDAEVRGMVAESIAFIGAAVHISVVEKDLWPCILKLSDDENPLVHAASMRTISSIATAHKKKEPKAAFYMDLLPHVFLQECSKIRKNAASDQRSVDDSSCIVLEINAQIFGELLHSCHDCFIDDSAQKEASKAFLAMSTCNGPAVRKLCAFNIPGVSVCLASKYGVELSGLVEFLSRDSDPETRWVLAAGIHETVRILAGRETIEHLFKAVTALLQDQNALVRMNTIGNFEALIRQLVEHHGYSSIDKLAPIFQNLQLLSEGDWRAQELLAEQLQLAAPVMPPPAIRSSVLPLLYQMSEGGTSRVRKATMAAIATCMRYLPDMTSRETTMNMFRVEWARGPVYWMRIAFIDSACTAVDSYSRCLFRDTYASELLKLAHDAVPNIRLRMALLLPNVASACYQMEEFHSALRALKVDEDVDVSNAMEDIDARIAKSLERGHACFEEDMKLEDEEQELLSRHHKARRDAQKKKGAVKHRTGVLLGKAAKGLHTNSSRMLSSQTSSFISRDGENGGDRSNSKVARTAMRKSLSLILNSDNTSPKGKSPFDSKLGKSPFDSKFGKRNKSVSPTQASCSSPTAHSDEDADISSSPFSGGIKGLRSLRPPKMTIQPPRQLSKRGKP